LLLYFLTPKVNFLFTSVSTFVSMAVASAILILRGWLVGKTDFLRKKANPINNHVGYCAQTHNRRAVDLDPAEAAQPATAQEERRTADDRWQKTTTFASSQTNRNNNNNKQTKQTDNKRRQTHRQTNTNRQRRHLFRFSARLRYYIYILMLINPGPLFLLYSCAFCIASAISLFSFFLLWPRIYQSELEHTTWQKRKKKILPDHLPTQ
jgi:cation transport ATPase